MQNSKRSPITERAMEFEAKRNFHFDLEDDDDEGFLSEVAAAEARALASKRRKIPNHTIDPPKTSIGEVSGKVSPNADAEGLYIAALKGDPSVLSQISGRTANSGNKGFVSANAAAQSEGGGSCFKCGKLGHWARDCDAPGGGGSFSASGNDSSVAEKACPCGMGTCYVLTANTERNRGRKFYKCPVRQENGGCGFFEWCDNAPAAATNVMSYGSQNHASSSSFPDLPCPCGAGSCTILTAKTGENAGQQYYRCPSYQATCGFFQWCKEQKPMVTKNQVSASKVYGNTNDTSKSFGATVRSGSSCYKCGGEGHWARDCSQSLASSNPPPAEFGRSQSSLGGTGTCFKCGQPGHWARDCSNC